jgi:hypothetical protein
VSDILARAGSTDWTGLATFVTSLGAVVVAIIGAFAALRVNKKVSTGNGVSIGESMSNVAAAVTTPPGVDSLGQIAADNATAIEHVHDAVCNPPDEAPPTPH